MSTTVEIKGELELYLRQLIDAGLYNNVAEAVRDSIRHQGLYPPPDERIR